MKKVTIVEVIEKRVLRDIQRYAETRSWIIQRSGYKILYVLGNNGTYYPFVCVYGDGGNYLVKRMDSLKKVSRDANDSSYQPNISRKLIFGKKECVK